MRRWVAALVVLCLGSCEPVFAFDDFPEPPFKWLLGWNVGELPGKAGLYFDLDGDKKPDLVTAHQIDKVEAVSRCQKHRRTAEHIIVGVGCRGESPKLYYLTRRVFAVRMVDEKWLVVSEKTYRRCVAPDYENVGCRRWEEGGVRVPKGD